MIRAKSLHDIAISNGRRGKIRCFDRQWAAVTASGQKQIRRVVGLKDTLSELCEWTFNSAPRSMTGLTMKSFMSRTLARPDLIGQKAPWPARGWDQSFFRSAEVDLNKVALSPSILPGTGNALCQADLVHGAQNSMIFPFCESGWGFSFFWNPGGT